jgi:hypothetical protein
MRANGHVSIATVIWWMFLHSSRVVATLMSLEL